MKGKVTFKFKPVGGATGVRHKIRIKDTDAGALVLGLSNFMLAVTPNKKAAEKFAASVFCVVSGKMDASQILSSYEEARGCADE